MGIISKLKRKKEVVSSKENIVKSDESQEKVYMMHYLYFNNRPFGEMHDCTCDAFSLPPRFSEKDAFKVISYFFEHTKSEIGSYRCCAETTYMLNQLGFESVSKEKKEKSKIVDLFSVISTDDGYLFGKSKYYNKYFEWYSEGITKFDVEYIFNSYGIDISKNEKFNPNVKIAQLEELSDNKLTKKEPLNEEKESIVDPNKIFVYMGTYVLEHENSESWYPVHEILVDENDNNAKYRKYKNIENGQIYDIEVDKCEYFEKENIIIYIPNARNFEERFTFEEDYNKLIRIYFQEFIENGREKAIELITSEERIKEIFSVENYMKENGISDCFYQDFYESAICNKKDNKRSDVLKRTKKPENDNNKKTK